MRNAAYCKIKETEKSNGGLMIFKKYADIEYESANLRFLLCG